MNINTIQDMWITDSIIDQNRLDDASVDCAKLHAKYLGIFNTAKIKLKKRELEMISLKHTKWRWYTGKMSKDEMDRLGYDYDPWAGGTKPMKSEINVYIESDEDIQELQLKVEYYKIITSTIEEILGNIRWRNSAIKNIIDFKKFTSGV